MNSVLWEKYHLCQSVIL